MDKADVINAMPFPDVNGANSRHLPTNQIRVSTAPFPNVACINTIVQFAENHNTAAIVSNKADVFGVQTFKDADKREMPTVSSQKIVIAITIVELLRHVPLVKENAGADGVPKPELVSMLELLCA